MNCPGRDRLSGLPVELLLCIFERGSRRDLSRLCRVSRHFHALIIPLLYKTLEIKCVRSADPLERFPATPGLQHLQNLTITTTLRSLAPGSIHCWHKDVEEWSVLHKFSETHENHFRYVFQRLPENVLRSFRWEAVDCVPISLLGYNGILAQYQTCIEELTLITDGRCDRKMITGEDTYDLGMFKQIRKFSWTGILLGEDLEAVQECLAANVGHLEKLKLELIDWSEADDLWYQHFTQFSNDRNRRENFFAQDILGLSNGSIGKQGMFFSALESLSLARLSFQSAVDCLVDAFSFLDLRELRLWNCPHTSDLLRHLVACQDSLSLQSLELTCGPDIDPDGMVKSTVVSLLQKIPCLRSVYLSLPVMEWDNIADSLYAHVDTLKHITLHPRIVHRDEESPDFDYIEDGSVNFCDGILHLLKKGHCRAIGLCIHPATLRKCLEPHISEVSCQILHIRAAGDYLTSDEFCIDCEGIEDFADWVFGPHGCPTLDVLVYGDFAFPDIYEAENRLYCRAGKIPGSGGSKNSRILKPDDQAWDIFQENMQTLAACPYTSLFRLRPEM